MAKELVWLFPLGATDRTRLWFTKHVVKEYDKNSDGHFVKILKRCAREGFEIYERGNHPYVRHKQDGVYAFQWSGSRFRILGFYEKAEKCDFVAIRAFVKPGRYYTKGQESLLAYVIKVKATRNWERAE